MSGVLRRFLRRCPHLQDDLEALPYWELPKMAVRGRVREIIAEVRKG